jgi:hypothetical protein
MDANHPIRHHPTTDITSARASCHSRYGIMSLVSCTNRSRLLKSVYLLRCTQRQTPKSKPFVELFFVGIHIERKNPMKCARLALQIFLSLAAGSMAIAQSSSGLRLYDNFNKDLIDPAKWYSGWQCQYSSAECEREIQSNRLRLRVRGYGSPEANSGNQFAASELFLTSANVTDIQAQVTVSKLSTEACATNTSINSGAHALLAGTFFNGSSGSAYTADDDVQAFVFLNHGGGSTEPGGVISVSGALQFHGQWITGSAWLGQIEVGENVTIELLWEQVKHRFVIRMFRPLDGSHQEAYMPYFMPDIRPAVTPSKFFSARALPANCVGSRPAVDIEVLIDDVRTN